MSGVSLGVTLNAAWRDTAGRFAHSPVAGSLDAQLQNLGRDAVRKLANATPVRTGTMRAGWRQSYLPSQTQLRITNQAPYAFYVAFGTRRQPPNPELQRVITQDLPAQLQVTSDAVGKDIKVGLIG